MEKSDRTREVIIPLDLKDELLLLSALFVMTSSVNLVDVTLTQCLSHTFKIRSWYIIIYGNTKVYSLTTPWSLKQ